MSPLPEAVAHNSRHQDLDVEDEVKSTLKQAPSGEVLARQKREYEDRSARTRRDEKVLFDQAGFGKEGDEGDRY